MVVNLDTLNSVQDYYRERFLGTYTDPAICLIIALIAHSFYVFRGLHKLRKQARGEVSQMLMLLHKLM